MPLIILGVSVLTVISVKKLFCDEIAGEVCGQGGGKKGLEISEELRTFYADNSDPWKLQPIASEKFF